MMLKILTHSYVLILCMDLPAYIQRILPLKYQVGLFILHVYNSKVKPHLCQIAHVYCIFCFAILPYFRLGQLIKSQQSSAVLSQAQYKAQKCFFLCGWDPVVSKKMKRKRLTYNRCGTIIGIYDIFKTFFKAYELF